MHIQSPPPCGRSKCLAERRKQFRLARKGEAMWERKPQMEFSICGDSPAFTGRARAPLRNVYNPARISVHALTIFSLSFSRCCRIPAFKKFSTSCGIPIFWNSASGSFSSS